LGLASSGLHSNGFSLARRVFETLGVGFDDVLPALGVPLGQALLTPTRIYAAATRALRAACGDALHGLAHITGGGLVGNVPRCLPDTLGARLTADSWQRPAIFEVISEQVDEAEMRRTFNLGVGLVAVVAPDAADAALAAAGTAGDSAWRLGEVIAAGSERVVFA
jgi:phosphoribosylformylglycinamidine cyclo-ligase